MVKYSIIVPVYNVEDYLGKCLDSIINQTYKNFEVILVNDGSTDKSLDIALEYSKKYDFIKVISQDNQGLSEARNNGIAVAGAPYFLLVDSDDYIEKDLLMNLDKVISNNTNVDLIRFQIRKVSSDSSFDYHEEDFSDLSGEDAFGKIVNYHYVENAWAYLYNTKFFKDNNFKFPKGRYHEDYALVPLIISKAKHVFSIDYIGYNYIVRENSIMNSNDYSKTLKKVSDFYDNYLEAVKNTSFPVLKSYYANSLILKVTELSLDDYNKYLKRLKKDKVFDNVLADTFPRKIKKLLIRISPKFYYRRH